MCGNLGSEEYLAAFHFALLRRPEQLKKRVSRPDGETANATLRLAVSLC
jgi:hypothetical protein